MGNDDTHDDWDSFDFARWGITPDADEAGADGANGAAPTGEPDDHYSDGFLRPALADVDDEAGTAGQNGVGRWVTQGGVLRWQTDDRDERDDEGAEAPLREEAQSPWAADQLELPLGAPATARLRAVRAWLARRRLRETELIGALLLERRRLTGDSAPDEDDAEATRPAPPENPHDPLALALAEAQAAADEYETLLDLLAETRAHVGPQAALVEYYLALTDRLAALATQPAAPDDFAEKTLFAQVERQGANGEVTPAHRSEWEGRAGAALAARQRVEKVTAAEPEDD